MKLKLWIVILVPLICVGVCVGSWMLTDRLADNLLAQTEVLHATLHAEDWPLAKEQAAALQKDWDARTRMAHLLSYHRITQEISVAVGGLVAGIDAQEVGESLIMLSNIEILLDVLKEVDALTLENII